jgi:hypothetical protein
MKIGPFTLSRGQLLPARYEGTTPQGRIIAADGSPVIVEHPYAKEEFLRVKVKLPKIEADTIAGYLEDGVGFARETTTIEDGYGKTFVVRYWDKRVRRTVVASNVVELDLLFRKEVTS